ncbi:flagellar protein FlgN [Nocardioides sp. Bht2]|uniref:flagellar protein FlgN n=1 Tax=Nocardioides sp. Bht2 TaxID=3392297 RepID=UPI0039B5A101
MEKLSLILWRERELLETLLFKLETEQLILASARTRWLGRASAEVEEVVQQIRETEVLRATASDEAAEGVGLAASASLLALAEAAPEPWATIMVEHRQAFVTLTAEVNALAGSNRELITAGYRSAREAMLALEAEGAGGYTPDGQAVTGTRGPVFVDRSL